MARAKIAVLETGQFYGIRFNCPGCAAGFGVDSVTFEDTDKE